MIQKKAQYISIVSFCLLFLFTHCVSSPKADNTVAGANNQKSTDCDKAYIMNTIELLYSFHYKTIRPDESNIRDIKKKFFYNLDPLGLYFLADDIIALCSMDFVLGDRNGKSLTNFLEKTTVSYKQRLLEVSEIINKIQTNPPEYKKNEFINFPTSDKITYQKNNIQRIEKWKKRLKYEILTQIVKKANIYDSIEHYNRFLQEKEVDIRYSVTSSQIKQIQDILHHPSGLYEYIITAFLNAIASCLDPHSAYISSQEVENYEKSMETIPNAYGIWINKNKQGETYIENMIPGSPGWRSSQLNHNDRILAIDIQSKQKQSIDFVELSVPEINDILNNKDSNLIVITVKKQNGLIKNVKLMKKNSVTDENIVSGFILNGQKKIGYIYLPAFYSEWETFNINGCSRDIAKEILKLKKENIDGIIMDLRDNGGGALIEAIELAGLFIDQGPLCVQVMRNGEQVVIKDPARGTVYDGPLAIIVNGQSASSSEIFTNVMKIYNRAVIIGSKTFGKATSQILLPIIEDAKCGNNKKNEPSETYALATITTDLYYDLEGNSFQIKGIVPDVVLPDLFDNFYEKEKDLDYVLHPGTIKVNAFYDKYNEIPRIKLSHLSGIRITENSVFQNINSLKKEIIKYETGNSEINLHIDSFVEAMKEERILFNTIENRLSSTSDSFIVNNTKTESELIKIDSYRKTTNDLLVENIKSDAYIQESYHIICDYINFINYQEE